MSPRRLLSTRACYERWCDGRVSIKVCGGDIWRTVAFNFLLQWLSYCRLTDKLESTSGGHLVQSPAQAGWSGAGFPGPCPGSFCRFPSTEAPLPLWVTCYLHNKKFLLSSTGMSYFKLRLLPVVLLQDATEKSLSVFFMPSFQQFQSQHKILVMIYLWLSS